MGEEAFLLPRLTLCPALLLVTKHFEAKLTCLFHTLVLEKLVDAARTQLLTVLKDPEVEEVPGVPVEVEWPPVDVSLAEA